MSRLGVTYEEVVEAAIAIQDNGETPSIDKVRLFLGSTGSFTTISKFLQLWRHQVAHGTLKKENKTAIPDVVQIAVDRVWQDIRDQTDKEILNIKTETQKAIGEAESRALNAESNFNELKSKHEQLLESYQVERAEKELLLLDVKKFHEEYALLQERANTLENRYAEMQSLTSQHLKDMSIAHQNEVARFEETCKVQTQNHALLIDEIRDHHEKMSQQHIATLHNIQVENKKSNDTIAKLQLEAQETFATIIKLESDLRALTVERDEAQNRLREQDKKWSFFDDKTLVPDGFIKKIYDAPTFDTLLDKINTTVLESLDNKFIEIIEENANLFDSSKYLENIKEKQCE